MFWHVMSCVFVDLLCSSVRDMQKLNILKLIKIIIGRLFEISFLINS